MFLSPALYVFIVSAMNLSYLERKRASSVISADMEGKNYLRNPFAAEPWSLDSSFNLSSAFDIGDFAEMTDVLSSQALDARDVFSAPTADLDIDKLLTSPESLSSFISNVSSNGGLEEMTPPPPMTVGALGSAPFSVSSVQKYHPHTTNESPTKNNNQLYKTEICRQWEEKGTCRYGNKCQFAHGEHELRESYKHPKYRTTECRSFHSTGSCPYGKRCRFLHIRAEDSGSRKAFLSLKIAECVQEGKLTPAGEHAQAATFSTRLPVFAHLESDS